MGIIKSSNKVSRLRGSHLFHFGLCYCSQKVRLCLDHKGLRWTSHEIDILRGLNSSPGYFQINPRGLVPVLVHNGKTIVESTDIMLYLENNFRGRPLYPNDVEKVEEMKILLALADAVHEAIFSLSLHFYFGRGAKKNYSQLQNLHQYCCTDRQIYEVHVLHAEGFDSERLRTYLHKLHSCISVLEQKLTDGRANLVGRDLSLADFAWAPVIYQALLMGFPLDCYPHVCKWFDIIEHSSTWQRAVVGWKKSWLQGFCGLKIGIYELFGCGLKGFDRNYQILYWLVPFTLLLLFLLCYIFFPAKRAFDCFPIPRILVLYCLFALLIGVTLLAFSQVHVTRCYSRPSSTFMQAIAAVDYRGLDTIRLLHHVQCPTLCHPNHIRVAVHAFSINPADIKLSAGYGHHLYNFYRQKHGMRAGRGQEFPVVLGRDFSGIVTEIGHNVESFALGDEVWGAVPSWFPGTMSEYIVIPECWARKKPSKLSYEEAASLAFVGCVALQVFQTVSQSNINIDLRGKKMLIHGGLGGVGSIAVQLAVAFGCHVTATCSAQAEHEVKRLGAHEVIVYETHHFERVLQEEKFDICMLTVCDQHILEASFRLMKYGSVLINLVNNVETLTSDYGMILGSVFTKFKLFTVYICKRIKYGTTYKSFKFDERRIADNLEQLSHLVEIGKVIPIVEKKYSLGNYFQAFQHVCKGHCHGKSVVSIRS